MNEQPKVCLHEQIEKTHGIWRCVACGAVGTATPPVVERHRALPVGAQPVGRKDDGEKPRWDLLPFGALARVVDVLTFGARKYGPDNWRRVENARDRYFAASLRHLAAYRGGEANDPETSLPHLAHAACCVLFMLALDEVRS